MSVTGSNNPFSCDPVVFANANTIVSLGSITRNGNQFTFSVGFVWKINGVTYRNTSPVVLTIAEASEGFQRIDNALLNTSNSIELQQGLESENIALRPIAPDTSIILTSWNISGDTIGNNQQPNTGSQYKQKSESQLYISAVSGENGVLLLQPQGQSHFVVQNETLVSLSGFDASLLPSVPNAETPYEGKDFFLENKTPNAILLLHQASAEFHFVFPTEQSLSLPAGSIVWFKFISGKMMFIMKSSTDGFIPLTGTTPTEPITGALKADADFSEGAGDLDFVQKKYVDTQDNAVKAWVAANFPNAAAVAAQITTALTGYATQAWVTSQGYITNVITALGFTPENVANKATNLTSPNDIKYPTTQAVVAGLAGKYDNFVEIIDNIVSTGTVSGTVYTLIKEYDIGALTNKRQLTFMFFAGKSVNVVETINIRVGIYDTVTNTETTLGVSNSTGQHVAIQRLGITLNTATQALTMLAPGIVALTDVAIINSAYSSLTLNFANPHKLRVYMSTSATAGSLPRVYSGYISLK